MDAVSISALPQSMRERERADIQFRIIRESIGRTGRNGKKYYSFIYLFI